MCEESITAAHAEVNSLHTTLEKKGINSRGTADVFGRVFEVPVDKEHKATQLPFTKCGNPHMRGTPAPRARCAQRPDPRADITLLTCLPPRPVSVPLVVVCFLLHLLLDLRRCSAHLDHQEAE